MYASSIVEFKLSSFDLYHMMECNNVAAMYAQEQQVLKPFATIQHDFKFSEIVEYR